jgi:hypothetical protein
MTEIIPSLSGNEREEYDLQRPMHGMDKAIVEGLERYAGVLVVRKLEQNEATAFQHLFHPKRKYRFVALSLLELKWGLTQEIVDVCEDMALFDSDAEVRALAVMNLSRYYAASDNIRIGYFLASLVHERNEDNRVCEAAYWGLLSLSETPKIQRPWILDFRFPRDVNWSFVNSFLDVGTAARTFVVTSACGIIAAGILALVGSTSAAATVAGAAALVFIVHRAWVHWVRRFRRRGVRRRITRYTKPATR